jgi:AcrR family transcriptional regulator
MSVSNDPQKRPPECNSEAMERLLDAAERLFARKGFAATTLRDIAGELSLSHASLYYHFPGGKEDLFAAVTERNILRHGAGLAERIAAGGPGIRGKLYGAADWLLSQPAMDLIRMAETDMPALAPEVARKLMNLVYVQMILRLQKEIQAAADAGELGRGTNAGLIAGAFIGVVESLHSMPDFAVRTTREDLAHELIDIVLKGLDYQNGGTR